MLVHAIAMIRAEGKVAAVSSHMHQVVISDIFSRPSIARLTLANAVFARRPVHCSNGAKERAKRTSTMLVAQFVADR